MNQVGVESTGIRRQPLYDFARCPLLDEYSHEPKNSEPDVNDQPVTKTIVRSPRAARADTDPRVPTLDAGQ